MSRLMPLRTLVLSLHRLGDLIMHAHVLKAYYEQSSASVSLLSHPYVKQVDFLLPFLDEIYIFERSLCQKSMGECFYNKEWPFKHISKILSDLNKRKFTKIVDITHSDTSARWMRFIEAQSKEGVSYNLSLTKKEFTAENLWFHYLHSLSRSRIHLIDLFKKAMNLELNLLPSYNENFLSFKRIIFQTNSSDIKKNWPVKAWVSLLKKLKEQRPHYELIILCSPDERRKTESDFFEMGHDIKVISCSIFEAYQLLKESTLLVTLDTSIKHLATWSQTPIVELALGSSDPIETGAYQNGALILQPSVQCSPCRHSSPCSQKAFLCHSELTVESVLRAINYRLNQENGFTRSNPLKPSYSFTQVTQRNQQYQSHLQSRSEESFRNTEGRILSARILEVSQSSDGWWRGIPVNLEVTHEPDNRDEGKIIAI